MCMYDPACVMRYRWYREVGTLDPRSRCVPPLGPVGLPVSMGNSTKGNLYTYIQFHTSFLGSLAPFSKAWKRSSIFFVQYTRLQLSQNRQTLVPNKTAKMWTFFFFQLWFVLWFAAGPPEPPSLGLYGVGRSFRRQCQGIFGLHQPANRTGKAVSNSFLVQKLGQLKRVWFLEPLKWCLWLAAVSFRTLWYGVKRTHKRTEEVLNVRKNTSLWMSKIIHKRIRISNLLYKITRIESIPRSSVGLSSYICSS